MKIYIVNGKPCSGKSTFEEQVWLKNTSNVFITSTIDPIKDIARNAGWNGKKDEISRKKLSDLKDFFTDWLDTSFNYINTQAQYCKAREGWQKGEMIMFVDCREPEEIARLKEELSNQYYVKTLLIKSNHSINANNHADQEVENYNYDIIINNDNFDDNFQTLNIAIDTFLQGEEIDFSK